MSDQQRKSHILRTTGTVGPRNCHRHGVPLHFLLTNISSQVIKGHLAPPLSMAFSFHHPASSSPFKSPSAYDLKNPVWRPIYLNYIQNANQALYVVQIDRSVKNKTMVTYYESSIKTTVNQPYDPQIYQKKQQADSVIPSHVWFRSSCK